MKTKLLKVLPMLLFVGTLFFGLGLMDVTHAAVSDYGIQTTGRGTTVSETELTQNVKNIINFVLGVLGLIAVCVIIYAGIRLTSSAGNDDAKENAKKIITYAIIGLLIVALSWVIVEFVTRALMAAETGGVPS